MVAPGLAAVLVFAGSVGGCAGCGQQPAAAPRTSVKPAAASAKATLVALEGRVLASADLISDHGGGVVANNGASIISNNGGALTSKAKLRLMQAATPWLPVEKAELELVDAAERPVPGVAPVRSDGTGRYRLLAPPGSWLVRVKANGARLSAFARVGSGRAEVDVSPATTVVAEFARARAAASRAGLEQVGEAAIATLVAQVEPLLASGRIALDLSSPASAVQVLERAADAEAQVRRQADALAAALLAARTETSAAPTGAGTSPSAATPAPPAGGATSPAAATPTPSPDPLLGTIIAGQAQLDPKPAAAADAANAVGVDLGVPDSLAVTADGTVFFTSPAGTLRAITPAGAYVAAPVEGAIGSRLASFKGEALFVDAARTKIVSASTVMGRPQPRVVLAVKGAPLVAGAPIAAASDGTFVVGHTLVDIDGDQSDFLATSASLANKPEPKGGALPTGLAFGTGGRLFVGYGTKGAGGNIYDVQAGGLIFNTYGSGAAWSLAADATGKLVVAQGGSVARREGAGKSVDLARGLDCGAIAFAPDGTLYYVDVGAIRRIKPSP